LKKFYFKRLFIRKEIKRIVGIVCAVVGVIIVIQVVPIWLWIFLLGILLLVLGWTFFRMI